MTLGEKLRQARLERGLTQAQVAGDQITRNMLSQLESDSASPSVRTLEYLASVLNVRVGWLLGDPAAEDGGRAQLAAARRLYEAGENQACAALLQGSPASQDEEGRLLLVRSAIGWSRQAFERGCIQEAEAAAGLAAEACPGSLYAGPQELAEANFLLARCALIRGGDSAEMVQAFQTQCMTLGLEGQRRLLLARYYLSQQQTQQAERELWSVPELSGTAKAEYLLLRGRLEIQKERYRDAVLYLRQAEQEPSLPLILKKELYAQLEISYREQEDYKQAYVYAARQLELLPSEAERKGTVL